jgi:NAD(P)-dependent dehydrogenase (short-subunit alcohol dehydrogenase family)
VELEGIGVVVSGGGNGIGAAGVRAFAQAGAKVAVLDIDDERAARGVGEGELAQCRYWHCDVSDDLEVRRVFGDLVPWLGDLHVLVNTAAYEAGPRRQVACEDLTDDDIERQMAVNLLGTVHTNQAAFRAMRRSGWGRIVNFSSDTAIRGGPFLAHYAASKGAVGAWTRTAALEWATHDICVNAIVPAMQTQRVEANRAATAARSPDEAARSEEALKRGIPHRLRGGWPGDPVTDLAPLLVFLAGPGAGFITGQSIAVNGGAIMLGA